MQAPEAAPLLLYLTRSECYSVPCPAQCSHHTDASGLPAQYHLCLSEKPLGTMRTPDPETRREGARRHPRYLPCRPVHPKSILALRKAPEHRAWPSFLSSLGLHSLPYSAGDSDRSHPAPRCSFYLWPNPLSDPSPLRYRRPCTASLQMCLPQIPTQCQWPANLAIWPQETCRDLAIHLLEELAPHQPCSASFPPGAAWYCGNRSVQSGGKRDMLPGEKPVSARRRPCVLTRLLEGSRCTWSRSPRALPWFWNDLWHSRDETRQ